MSHPLTNSMWVTAQFLHRNLIMSHCVMTNRQWVTLFLFQAIISHCTTDREWVTMLYCSARQSHQSFLIPWSTGSEWHCIISLPGISSIMSHPMTNRKWVTLLYFFAYTASLIISWHLMTKSMWVIILYCFSRWQSHQLCCVIPWPTVCEWHFSLPDILINHISSHGQWVSMSVMLLYFLDMQSYQSCLIPWLTGGEWHCSISFSRQSHPCGHISSYDQQGVSDTATLFLC